MGYYQNDHLGTPQRIISASGQVLWGAHYEAFGWGTVTDELVVNNLRFAGQYYDGETGLHYNYFRYYDPQTGRYITSDPIGLQGGLNTYGYVGGNPLGDYDPYGLYSWYEFVDDSANFSAGFGDSISFGITSAIRNQWDIGNVDKCSGTYAAGEYTEIGIELALTGGSALLKHLASKASRDQVRNAFRRYSSDIARNGKKLHHNHPLFGHPGGSSTLFPTGGLPTWLNSSSWNTRLLDGPAHTAVHRRLRKLEAFARKAVNPYMTAGRVAANAARGCGC